MFVRLNYRSFLRCAMSCYSCMLTMQLICGASRAQEVPSAAKIAVPQVLAQVLSGDFRWDVGPPLLTVDALRLPESEEHPWVAIKDPSIVKHEGRWHLFCTLRKKKEGEGRIRIGHLAFDDWHAAKDANWSVLELTNDYHGAPQGFYFAPQKLWYLIYQAADATRQLKYGPCFSTNPDLNDPHGWTLPEPLYVVKEGAQAGLDYWVICDEQKAYLFFTSLNGQMWRAETQLGNFPNRGWSDPVVALKADIFEASHTYALQSTGKYLTFIEARYKGKSRYFKAYLADRLDGPWRPLAGSYEQPFASPANVNRQEISWATSYSHGELLRNGVDQRMEVDPANLRLVFQGANDAEYTRENYGDIPWKLGILTFSQHSPTRE